MNRRRFLINSSSFCSLAAIDRILYAPNQESGQQKRVRAQLDQGVANELTVGAVAMVAESDEVKVLESAGYADRDSHRPMRTDAIFDIRSISKPITVLGALLLVREGKLKLDSGLSAILPSSHFPGSLDRINPQRFRPPCGSL